MSTLPIHPFDLAIIGGYLVLLVGIGWWFRRRSVGGVEGYYLGGRQLPGWMLGLSGAAANIDVSGTLVIVSWLFMLGLNGYWGLTSGHVPITMAVIVVLIGKWIRRSGAVTSNEYIEMRFGSTTAGRLSRSISTFGQLLGLLTALAYFLIGSGKFFAPYLPLDLPSESAALLSGEAVPFFTKETVAALCLIGIGLAYSLVSGYAGVVGGDLVQIATILLSFGILIVTALIHVTPETLAMVAGQNPQWFSTLPPTEFDTSPYGNRYRGFEAFALICGFFVFKNTILGFSAVQGYTAQRWLSCRSDKDAGIMGVVWLGTLVFRWAAVMGVALLGWVLVERHHGSELARLLRADPEVIFPHVVNAFIPVGLTGIVFAGLMAAALSTAASFLNAGASFLVRDVYQLWMRPRAGPREITLANYGAVLLLILLALLFSKSFRNVNDIWTWLMAGWGGAKFVPMLMFWYWHRGNGTGFAVGSLCGLVAALWQRFQFPEASPVVQFAISSIPSTIGFCLGALLTRPVEPAVLATFFARVRPWGFWGPIRARFTPESLEPMRREHRRDIVAVLCAVPWLLSFYLSALLVMTHQWGRFAVVAAVCAALSWGLYRWWFRWLGEESPPLVPKPAEPLCGEGAGP